MPASFGTTLSPGGVEWVLAHELEHMNDFRNPVEQEQLILRSTRHRLPGPAATFAITVAVLTPDSRRTCRHAFFFGGIEAGELASMWDTR